MPAFFMEADAVNAVSHSPALPARAALALLGFACVLPFLSPVFLPPISSFYGEAVAAALGLAAVAMMAARSLWTGMRLPRISLMFLGFAGLMVLQIALGRALYQQLNLLGALYVLWAAALAMLANRLVRIFGPATFAATLAWFLVVGAAISALIGLIQLFGVRTPLAPFLMPQIHSRIYANTGQPNHLASYLCFGLVSAGYLWSTRRLGLIPAACVCVVMLAVLAISGSRAVWLYALIFIVLAAAMGKLQPSAEPRRLLMFSIALAVGLVAAQWAMSGLVSQQSIVAQTIGARVQAVGLSSPIRLHFWRQAWAMFASAPVFGVGFKQFAWNNFLLTGQASGLATDEGIIDHAHNLIFQIAAEFGVSGLIVLLGGVGWWGWSLRSARIDTSLWWMAAVLGVLGLHSMLEYPLWYAYFLGIAAVVLGAAEQEAPAYEKPGGRIILCAAVVLGAFAFANVYGDYRTLQSLQGTAKHVSASASGAGDGNGNLQVLVDMQRSSLFAPFIEFAIARRMSLNREHLDDKIVLNWRAMRFQPSNDFVYRQALLLAMSGDLAGMRTQWDMAVFNYPKDRDEILTVVQVLEKSGEAGMKELLDYAQQQDEKAKK